MIFRYGCLFVMMCFSSATLWCAQLNTVGVKQQRNQTSLFLNLNGPFTHKLFLLSSPERVIIDLKATRLAPNFKQIGEAKTLIQQIRTGRPNDNTLRLVLDVSQKVKVRSAPWRSQNGSYGLRVDLLYSHEPRSIKHLPSIAPKLPVKMNVSQPLQLAIKKPISHKTPPPVVHKAPISLSHRHSKSLRDVIIVLDAGHGGKDIGARGPHRSREKDVVLAITLKLKRLIDRQKGMHAVLTRSGDYYVGLRKRLDIARKYNGDLFVAIHADAFHSADSNGASVFALSQRGATSEAAHWLAEKENYSELGEVNLGQLDDSNGLVRSVLIDLSQTATINAGLQVGRRVLSQLGSFTNLHNIRVEQARFVVLKSPDIPSILVETGFISNPREERNLNNSVYQMHLSQAIFQGIKGYFWENPPRGSRIEAMVPNKFHLVRSGDTLSQIALNNHVSVQTLEKLNHLQQGSHHLKQGQKLVISTA